MRRPEDFRILAVLLLLPLGGLVATEPALSARATGSCATSTAACRRPRRLRINAHGPVTVQAGAANRISYTVHLSVRARTEAEARVVMQRYSVRVAPQGEWVVLHRARRSGDLDSHGEDAAPGPAW